jgi:hypothetical protein
MTSLDDALELVRATLAKLRFGEITIAIHDGEIVQIARTEKIRPDRGPSPGGRTRGDRP